MLPLSLAEPWSNKNHSKNVAKPSHKEDHGREIWAKMGVHLLLEIISQLRYSFHSCGFVSNQTFNPNKTMDLGSLKGGCP